MAKMYSGYKVYKVYGYSGYKELHLKQQSRTRQEAKGAPTLTQYMGERATKEF